MCKKISGLLFLFFLAGFVVSAQTGQTTTNNQKTTTVKTTPVNKGPNFVDKNNDGICDYRQNSQGNANKGKNYVDKNNDGVCDNYGKRSSGNCQNKGQGRRGQGNGCGRGNGCRQNQGN